MGDLAEVAPGSPPLLVVNLEVDLLGPSKSDAASAAELTVEDYQEKAGGGGHDARGTSVGGTGIGGASTRGPAPKETAQEKSMREESGTILM
jgi:hypothetical protein